MFLRFSNVRRISELFLHSEKNHSITQSLRSNKLNSSSESKEQFALKIISKSVLHSLFTLDDNNNMINHLMIIIN